MFSCGISIFSSIVPIDVVCAFNSDFMTTKRAGCRHIQLIVPVGLCKKSYKVNGVGMADTAVKSLTAISLWPFCESIYSEILTIQTDESRSLLI
jgi:hypothetical protein